MWYICMQLTFASLFAMIVRWTSEENHETRAVSRQPGCIFSGSFKLYVRCFVRFCLGPRCCLFRSLYILLARRARTREFTIPATKATKQALIVRWLLGRPGLVPPRRENSRTSSPRIGSARNSRAEALSRGEGDPAKVQNSRGRGEGGRTAGTREGARYERRGCPGGGAKCRVLPRARKVPRSRY